MKKQARYLFLLSSLFLALLSGCKEEQQETLGPKPNRAPAFAFHQWDRIDGSTATIPLTATMAAELGRVPIAKARELLTHNTTHDAYVNLIEGRADLIFVTSPSSDELEMAEAAGVQLEVIPVVKDAFVFLANTENPVSGLTLEQYRKIYLREIQNWREVGGLKEEIIPYQRPDNSGSQTLFYKLVMTEQKPVDPPDEWVEGDMGGLVNAIANYENSRSALGYSVYYYVRNMYGQGEAFKLLAVDGVAPTDATILSGEYPLTDAYYAVLRADTPRSSDFRKLVDWLLSADGQAVAQKAGYVADVESPYPYEKTHQSSGTAGKEGSLDLNKLPDPEEITRLSDLFYDGVNYIAYINGQLANQMFSEYAYDSHMEGMMSQGLLRPFSGIPNDYQDFSIGRWSQELGISFGEGNPFFADEKWFSIPLPTQLSPYGVADARGPEQAYRFTFEHYTAGNGEDYSDVKPIVLQAANWGTEKKINALIDTWYKENLKTPSLYGPYISRWGDYLFFHFEFRQEGDDENTLVKSLDIDMKRGALVDWKELQAMVPMDRWWQLEGNYYSYEDSSKGWRESMDLPEGYAPSADTVCHFVEDDLILEVVDPQLGEFEVDFSLSEVMELAGWPPQDSETLATFNLN